MSNDVILCQKEIQRLRCVVKTYESQMRELENYLGQMAENQIFLHSEYVPSDSAALETVLWQEEQKRRDMRCGKIENHIRNIRRMAA